MDLGIFMLLHYGISYYQNTAYDYELYYVHIAMLCYVVCYELHGMFYVEHYIVYDHTMLYELYYILKKDAIYDDYKYVMFYELYQYYASKYVGMYQNYMFHIVHINAMLYQ